MRSPQRRSRIALGPPLPGLVLLAVGLVFLLDNLDLVESGTILRFWPLILLVAGLKNLIAAQDRGSAVSGTLLDAVGALLLLNALNLIDVDLRDFWPVILVPIGIGPSWKATSKPPERERDPAGADGDRAGEPAYPGRRG